MFQQTRIPTARWEHHDDFHLTLRFIAIWMLPSMNANKLALATVKVAPFEFVCYRVLVRFPPQEKRPPTVLWAGVQLTPELVDLQSKVTSILEAEGLDKDKHEGYSPHITLARCEPISSWMNWIAS
jgi:2'-5' RNA ligase